MEMEEKFCQSCGMPLKSPEDHGTNADGSKNEDYCVYCYQNGAFAQDCTMEEMIDFCLNCEGAPAFGSREEAEKAMREWFPTLKRWRQ